MAAITVVVPLYNKAATVSATLASALAQTFSDIEIIVVDDGSTDGGAGLVAGIDDPRLTLILQDNAGVSAARNRAILASRADWIALLDADDHWDPDHLEKLWHAVQGSDAIAAFANVRLESRPERPMINPDTPGRLLKDYFGFALAEGGYPNMTSAMIMRREAAIAAGLFTVGVASGEDVDLWCRLALRGPLLYTGDCTATYNDGPRAAEGARSAARVPAYPFFAGCLPALFANEEVPGALGLSVRRYANFLLLEYARQLLDRGMHAEARNVLMRNCDPWLDPQRFFRRLARTYPLGRLAFSLSNRRVQLQ